MGENHRVQSTHFQFCFSLLCVQVPLKSSDVEAPPRVDRFAQDAISSSDAVKLLDITFLSQFRADGHPSQWAAAGKELLKPQDCLHWCLPGVPDVWNQMLFAKISGIGPQETSQTTIRSR